MNNFNSINITTCIIIKCNNQFTFIDLYMKPGLYIAEIVKRLYRCKNMKKLYEKYCIRMENLDENKI